MSCKRRYVTASAVTALLGGMSILVGCTTTQSVSYPSTNKNAAGADESCPTKLDKKIQCKVTVERGKVVRLDAATPSAYWLKLDGTSPPCQDGLVDNSGKDRWSYQRITNEFPSQPNNAWIQSGRAEILFKPEGSERGCTVTMQWGPKSN